MLTKAVVLVTYACYPGFSNTLFQAYNCHTVDGTRYLRRDYQLNCDSVEHVVAQVFAALGIAYCSIGIPALYLVILRRHIGKSQHGAESTETEAGGGKDKASAEAGVEAGALDRSASHLDFFVADYEPRFWYWEAVELARKLLLTGFAALWLPGTLMQVIMSMFIALANALLVARCRPYCGHADASTLEETSEQLELDVYQ